MNTMYESLLSIRLHVADLYRAANGNGPAGARRYRLRCFCLCKWPVRVTLIAELNCRGQVERHRLIPCRSHCPRCHHALNERTLRLDMARLRWHAQSRARRLAHRLSNTAQRSR